MGVIFILTLIYPETSSIGVSALKDVQNDTVSIYDTRTSSHKDYRRKQSQVEPKIMNALVYSLCASYLAYYPQAQLNETREWHCEYPIFSKADWILPLKLPLKE